MDDNSSDVFYKGKFEIETCSREGSRNDCLPYCGFQEVYDMGKHTVRRRIFISNALMVLITLFILLMINMFVIKAYFEYIEHELESSIEGAVDKDGLEELLEGYSIHRNGFILLFLADGVLCIAVLVIISQIFTRRLVNHIMEPLDALADGAHRIRNNDLTRDIEYSGDAEFENVCCTFNEMRGAILAGQEKNRKYEKARTDMIAGISHDLRTPLTAVRGTIKGLLDGVALTPERQTKFLETAYRRTGDMALLLNQLFYLSKLETGNMPFDFKTIDICEFIANYVRGKQELLENGQAEITAEIKECAGYVSVDPEQLQRIFDNLLENSRKYGNVEPLKMKISLERNKEGFCICFSDNGVGVPEEKLPFIFDEFYRGDESRNKKEGNGLGLYIVRYLTEAMGGSVRAENAGGLAVCLELREAELSSTVQTGEGV